MPLFTRVAVRTALVWLLLALLVRLGRALALLPEVWRPVEVHLFVVGWATQLIFGVAWWLFPLPPLPSGTPPTAVHRDPWGWWAYGLLNVGLLLRAVGEPLLPPAQEPLLVLGRIGLGAAALLQTLGVAIFVGKLWPRVRGRDPGRGRGRDRGRGGGR